MLHKVLYSKTSDLYHTNFLSLQQGTLVVPGPEVADLWRQELNLSKISMETLTYADWIKELLSQSGSADRIQFSKSELWDVLHRVWKNSDAPENFNLFQKVFDLYTDLKSMTNDASIFKQVLSMETALQESTLVLLERVYALKEINDEYQNVRDIIAEVEERGLQWLEGKKIHLVGFKILSGLQIDLLQKLAQHAEIYVYVPKYLDAIIYERSLNDWPSWLKPEKTHHLESHSYSSSHHAYTIYPVSEMDSIWSMLRGKTVYILTSKNDLSQCHWGQSRIAYSMKSTSNVGISGSSSVMALIREELMVSSKTWHQLLQIIEKEYKSHLIKKNNYPKLKWLQYTKNWIDIKLEHIEKETEFSWLDFNVLKQKIELDAVRLHWQVYSEHEETIKIEQLQKGLFFYSSSEKIIVIDEPIQQKISEEKYTANSSKLLS